MPVFPWLASVSNVPFRLNTQNQLLNTELHINWIPPSCSGTLLQKSGVNASCNIKLTLSPKIQPYRDVKIDLFVAIWKAGGFE